VKGRVLNTHITRTKYYLPDIIRLFLLLQGYFFLPRSFNGIILPRLMFKEILITIVIVISISFLMTR